MPDAIAEYTFVSWLRQGIAASIEQPDDLGAGPDAAVIERASLSVTASVGYIPKGGGAEVTLPEITKRVEIVGPGDILGIKSEAILRTEPYANAVNVTPGELAYVEFYEEDFPWRYTPARPAAANEDANKLHKLRPWIALFVLRIDEFTLAERPGKSPVLTLTANADLPPVDETWAWAHAQISRAIAGVDSVAQAIAENPDHALSRLLSPRRLLVDAAYDAFIVPAFETGRLGGLDLPLDNVPAQKPSWGTPESQADPRYPVYYHWNFKTGASGDFESLVRKLKPGPAGQAFGKRVMDVSNPGYGVSSSDVSAVSLEGALKPPDFSRSDFPAEPGADIVSEIEAVVDLSENMQQPGLGDIAHPFATTADRPSGYAPILRPTGVAEELPDDPIVSPPAYGRWHADVARVADATDDASLGWLRELNLDPRSRAAAGLGSEVVRQAQEDLMERAWNQVGELEAANQRLREAELAAAAAEALFDKHIASAGADRVVTLTAAAQHGLRSGGSGRSIRGAVVESRVPVAAQAATFKRMTRPQRKLMRRLTGSAHVEAFQRDLLTNMNQGPEQAISAARPRSEPGASIGLDAVTSAIDASISKFVVDGLTPRQLFVQLLYDDLRSRRLANPPQDLALLTLGGMRATLLASLAAAVPQNSSPEEIAVGQRVTQIINAMSAFNADGDDAVRVTVQAATFDAEFGGGIAGKTFKGVTVVSDAAAADGAIARMTDVAELQQYQADVAQFATDIVSGRPAPPPRPPLATIATIASSVIDRMRPSRATIARVASALPAVGDEVLARDPALPRRARAVMAYPEFVDPMFESLRKLSQDYILPNASNMPKDTMTLMEPNRRFVEAYFAGLNHEMAAELLWREYPTDRRGTYFRVFWDTRDALDNPGRTDIKPMHEWSEALGTQGDAAAGSVVLVIRGELLLKFPDTVVYAVEADWRDGDPAKPRVLKADGAVKFPSFHARLDPDVTIVGFDLSKADARGHRRVDPADAEAPRPGWFFVLKERPGQVRFGLDETTPDGGMQTWDDLAWDAIQFAGGTSSISLADNNALAPLGPSAATWGLTSADMAYILFQSPIMYARHAEEMLP